MCKVRWNWHSDSGEEIENVKDIETDAIKKRLKKALELLAHFSYNLNTHEIFILLKNALEDEYLSEIGIKLSPKSIILFKLM